MADLKELKSQFLEYLEIEKGRSVKTVENYDRYLSRFLAHTGITSPTKVTEQAVREFRIHLNRQAGTSGTMKLKTINYYMISLRAFLKFMRKRDIESLNPERIELAKVGQRDLDVQRRTGIQPCAKLRLERHVLQRRRPVAPHPG